MTNEQIKAIFLANGFKEKLQGEVTDGEGVYDLNPYVYEAARALMSAYACELGHHLTIGWGGMEACELCNKVLSMPPVEAPSEDAAKLYIQQIGRSHRKPVKP